MATKTTPQNTAYSRKMDKFIMDANKINLNDEQERIYNAFCADKSTIIRVSDLLGIIEAVKIITNNLGYGSTHIIVKHFDEKEDGVSAEEIVNMLYIVRTAKPKEERTVGSSGKARCRRVYEKTMKGVRHCVVIEPNKNKVGTLITYYTNKKNRK